MAVVVPTKVLAHQWREQLERNLRLRRDWIGEQHSDVRILWQSEHQVLIAVVNSARTRLAGVLDSWRRDNFKAVLIVDECHRAGSEYNSRIFEGHYDYSLGLSATPERDDFGHEDHIYPGLGDPVYRYPLLDALEDGVLAPLLSVNLYVDFDPGERARWLDLSEDISSAFRNLMWLYPQLQSAPDHVLLREIGKLAEREDPLALKLQKLLADRRQLLASASGRRSCQRAILEWLTSTRHRALVFHETISAAEASHGVLVEELRTKAGIDHSGLHRLVRSAAMEDFKKERSQVLVAVRALDEGVDVPDASVAVITAGSRSRRQRIQRFGRVLRPAEGKRALVLTILVRGTPEEAAVGGRDFSLIGPDRVRNHRWPGTPVAAAIDAPASTYRPDQPEYAVEDVLTLLDMGLWEPGTASAARPRPSATGGYGTHQVDFSPNRWYTANEVRDGIGVPEGEFNRLRRDVRSVFRQSLDPERVNDLSLIHGSEIEAVRREWRRRERGRANLGRKRR